MCHILSLYVLRWDSKASSAFPAVQTDVHCGFNGAESLKALRIDVSVDQSKMSEVESGKGGCIHRPSSSPIHFTLLTSRQLQDVGTCRDVAFLVGDYTTSTLINVAIVSGRRGGWSRRLKQPLEGYSSLNI